MVPPPDPADPFGLSDLRTAVLNAWAASPARFREDANAEESLAMSGYADRVLIELAANGVDAARAAGEPARLRIELVGDELRVANNGAPVTIAGAIGLASLRASAKRGQDAVGHFGVGFTAVLGLSDAPRVISRSGGIAFDRERTAAAVRDLDQPALTAELTARAGQAPALRLPFVAPDLDPVPIGYTTEIRLPLRQPADPDLIDGLLDAAVDHLFWALPGLVEVASPGRTVRRIDARVDDAVVADDTPGRRTVLIRDTAAADRRCAVQSRSGRIEPALLAGRPVEEQGRDRWTLTWVLPLDPEGAPEAYRDAQPIGAPTPTDDRLTLPARLVGTFPVDDTRRHLATGPLVDWLVERAADGYLELVGSLPVEIRTALIPPAGFPVGPVDGRLAAAIVERWSVAELLLTAAGDPISPRRAVVLPQVGPDAERLLVQAVPELVPAPTGRAMDALTRLGVRTMTAAEAVSALASVTRPPAFWREIYSVVGNLDPDALASLPVPLADGRQHLGVRGVLLPDDEGLATRAALVVPGLAVVHPEAVHPLLTRLGARPADPSSVLATPELLAEIRDRRAELEDDLDPADDPTRFTALAIVVGDLVAGGGRVDDDRLAELILTDVEGEPWPAGELMIPGAELADVIAPGELGVLDQQWLTRWDPATVLALGVRNGFRVVPLVGSNGSTTTLPDLDDWWAEVIGDRPGPEDAVGVADLDLIDDDRWDAALTLLAAGRDTRAAVVDPDGYTAWWIRRFGLLAGGPPAAVRLPSASDLDGLYDPLPVELDQQVAAAVGVRTGLAAALADRPADVLARWADPTRTIAVQRVPEITRRLVAALRQWDHPLDNGLPDTVRTLSGAVISADQAVVPDGPWWAQVLTADRLVAPGDHPAGTASALDLELASEAVAVVVPADPDPADPDPAQPATPTQPAEPSEMAERAAAELQITAPSLQVRLGLVVLIDGIARPVAWWPAATGWWVDGTAAGVGRAVAWVAGRWNLRQVAVAAARGDAVAVLEGRLE